MSAAAMIAATVLAGAWIVSLEVRRKDRRRLAVRIGASVVAMGALAAIALEPALPRRAVSERIVLAADGASRRAAEELAESVAALRVLSLDSIGDLAALKRRFPSVREVIVSGWGLPREELVRAGDLRLDAVTAPLPPGIRFVDWPSRILLGERVSIAGHAGPGSWVRLRAGGLLDSVRTAGNGSFALQFTPRAAGLQHFTLHTARTTDTGAIDVRLPTPPAVLILEGAPDFELAHLRRWLAARGARVGMRTAISRGRTRTHAINGAPAPGRALSAELLKNFDVAIMDELAAGALSPSELALLRNAVTRDGLGVLLTGERPRLEGLAAAPPRASRGARAVRVRTLGGGEFSPPIGAAPLQLQTDAAATPVLEEANGRPAALSRVAGTGRIGISAIRNPSRWLLEGESAAFDRYWTSILASLARPRARWRSPPPLPGIAGRPFRIIWPARLDSVLVLGPERTDTVYLVPDADSLTWSAEFWPAAPGEYRAVGPGDTLRFRIAGAGSWRSARAAANARATALHGAVHTRDSASADAIVRVAIAPWIFVVLFTGSAGWLWWERRQHASG